MHSAASWALGRKIARNAAGARRPWVKWAAERTDSHANGDGGVLLSDFNAYSRAATWLPASRLMSMPAKAARNERAVLRKKRSRSFAIHDKSLLFLIDLAVRVLETLAVAMIHCNGCRRLTRQLMFMLKADGNCVSHKRGYRLSGVF